MKQVHDLRRLASFDIRCSPESLRRDSPPPAETGEYATFLHGTTEPMLEKPFNLEVLQREVVQRVARVLLNEQAT